MSIDDRSLTQAEAPPRGPPEHAHLDEPPPQSTPILHIDEARRRRLRPWAILGVAVVVLGAGGVTLSYTSVFGARVVQVEGEEHLEPRQVLRTAGVNLGTNVVHIDEGAVESRLEMEPWILDSTVETSLPGSIVISVTERTPVLVSELNGARRMVAGDGTVLGRAPWSIALPKVATAAGAPVSIEVIQAAGDLVRAMAPALRVRVETVVVATDGTAALVVDGGVDVRYGMVVETSAKAMALRAILEFAEREGRELVSIDVSAPAAPTARFEGSPTPISAPDPSADVPAPSATPDTGTNSDIDASPSPSV